MFYRNGNSVDRKEDKQRRMEADGQKDTGTILERQ